MLGLRFCARAFSSCGERWPFFIAVHGPFTVAALLLRSTGSRRAGSVVVAHGTSCSAACGIPPDQGLNLCPLHWQADSQPLHHQGSPLEYFYLRALRVEDCSSRVRVRLGGLLLWLTTSQVKSSVLWLPKKWMVGQTAEARRTTILQPVTQNPHSQKDRQDEKAKGYVPDEGTR